MCTVEPCRIAKRDNCMKNKYKLTSQWCSNLSQILSTVKAKAILWNKWRMFSVFSVKKKGRKGWFLLWIYGVCFIGKKPQLQHITWTCSTWSLWEGFFLSLRPMYIRWLVKKDGWLGWDNYTVEMILYLLLLFSRSHLILIRNFNSVLQCHWQHDFEVRILSAHGGGGL